MNETNQNTQATLDHRPGIMGIHSSRAVEFLKAGKPGDQVTRQKMAEIIGRPCDPHGPGYGNVQSAINRVEVDYGIVWRWDLALKVWVCLDDAQRIGVLKDSIRIAKKRVKRGLRVANTVDVAKLTDEQQREHRLSIAAAGVMHLCGSGGFVKRLQAIDKPSKPDVGRLIELMR